MAKRDMDEVKYYTIYMYTFPNDKKYIGKSAYSLSHRQGHNWNKYSNCTLLWRAIQKYGTENIKTTILFEGEISHKEAAELERKYIAEYKTNTNRYTNPQYGYNLTDGGEGMTGWHPTPERAEQMKKQFEGTEEKKLAALRSEEVRKKMSDAKKGKKTGPHSEETKQKIGAKNSFKNMSEEKREKIRTIRQKKTIVENIETGEKLEFDSRNDVADYFGVAPCTVSTYVNNRKIVKRNNIKYIVYDNNE